MGHQKYTHTHTHTFTFTYTYTYLFLQYCCHGLSFHNLCQAQLGTKFGGLGLRSSKAYAAAAYLSSFLSLEKKFKPLTFFPDYPVFTF